jgi:hypothetical protein
MPQLAAEIGSLRILVIYSLLAELMEVGSINIMLVFCDSFQDLRLECQAASDIFLTWLTFLIHDLRLSPASKSSLAGDFSNWHVGLSKQPWQLPVELFLLLDELPPFLHERQLSLLGTICGYLVFFF